MQSVLHFISQAITFGFSLLALLSIIFGVLWLKSNCGSFIFEEVATLLNWRPTGRHYQKRSV